MAPNHHLHIPVPHFTVGALKDAWAYDEDDELDGGDGDEVMGSVDTTTGHKSRLSMGGGRQHNRRDAGVEKRGNVTKVGIEVEIALNAEGPVEVSVIMIQNLVVSSSWATWIVSFILDRIVPNPRASTDVDCRNRNRSRASRPPRTKTIAADTIS